MSKKDFFRLIIKLFGLYALILTIFNFIPTNIGYVIADFEPVVLVWIVGVVVVIVLFYIFLIRKTDLIVDWLKLDKGFDDDRIELGNFNSKRIIQFALIIIGGFLLIDHLPYFLQYCYLAFKEQVSPGGMAMTYDLEFGKTIDYFDWAISAVNILVGYILVTNYRRVSNWLTRKDNDTEK
jgi:hypothetical protein